MSPRGVTRMALVVVGVVVSILLGLAACNLLKAPGKAAEAKAGKAVAEGQVVSGREAVQITGNVMGQEQATDAITRTNADDIRKAPGADAAVDPGLAAAGLRGLCRRPSYRDLPKCVQFAGGR